MSIKRCECKTIGIPEAARILGISRSLAYALARKGELPGTIALGKRLVVSRAALERVLNGEIQGERGDYGGAGGN